MIKYNPLFKNDGTQNGALTTAPSDSIIFDLPGKCIWVKGVKLKGTDTTYTFSHDDYITLANTPGDPEDIKIGVDTTALKNAIDTTYGVVSATVDGLAPKYSLGNKTTTDFYTSLYCLGVVGSTLKWYQIPHRTVRINSDANDKLTSNDGEPLRISAGTNIGVTWDSTNKSIVISNTATIPVNTDSNVAQYLTSDNNDYRILFKGTVNNESEIWSTKFASTLLYNPSTKILKVDGNTVLHAGNVNNSDATIGTSLTTIATIGGVDIKAKIASYSLSNHTHPLSIAADSGTSSIALAASTKYKLTAGGSTYVFTSTPDENVKLVDNNNNENVPILLKNGTGTDTITSSVRTVDGITVNPSTNSLSINGSLNVGGGSRISGLVQLRQLASDTLAWIEVYSNDWSTRYGWLGTSWETSTLLWNGYTIYHSGNLPAYPTVNNASLTLQVRETTLTTFYANDSTNRIFNVTNALLGNSISWDTVTINDTGRRFVRSIYNSTSNLNEFALYGNAIGMESLGDNGSNDNPGGYTGWHHIFLATWVDTREVNGSTTNEWCTQIANRCGTTDLWVRSRSGGSISNGTAWGANWTRILTGSNWTDVITLPTVNNASLTLLTAGNTQTTFYANDSTDRVFNVTCANIGAATSGHTHNSLHGDDNRSVNNNPAWYMTNVGKASMYTEFCMSGGAVSNSYENRTTFTPWGDNSGQRPVQLAFNNSGMFMRTSASDTDWNAWNTIVHSGNVTNSNTTLTTSLLTIATIAGVEIKAAITNYNTDFNVQQTPKTDNVNRPLMMINGSTSAGELTTTTMFSTGIYANASTNMITANGFIKTGSDKDHVLLGDGSHDKFLLPLNTSPASTIATNKGSWTPISGRYVYRQNWTDSSTGGDTADLSIYLDGNLTANICLDGYFNTLCGYRVIGKDNTEVLLAGGGTKFISDFATSGHNHKYLSTIASISGSTHAEALQTQFTNNKANIPRDVLINYYSSAYNNGSQCFGYFLSGYDSNPYGGFFVAHYDTPWYVGISNGTFTQWELSRVGHTHDDRYYTESEADGRYLKLSGGTMTGDIGMGGDSDGFLISSGSSGANSPLRGTKMPETSSNWIGLFARPGKSTDEGGLLLSEDTCVIYNSHDTGWGFLVVDTDLSQNDWSVTTAQAFGVNSSHQAWALGGFVKAGSDDTYVLLGGGGHKALSDFAMSGAYLPLIGGTMTGIINRDAGGAWISARDNVIIKTIRTSNEGSDWHPAVGIKTSSGFWSFGSVGGEHLGFSYDTDANYLAGNNTSTVINMPLKAGTIALTSDISDYTYSKSESDNKYLPVTYSSSESFNTMLTVTGNTNYLRMLRIMSPNLSAGYHNDLLVGVADSAYNTALFGFYYAGADSQSNFAYFGMHSVDDQFIINGYGNIGIGTTSPLEKLHIASGSLIITNPTSGSYNEGIRISGAGAKDGTYSTICVGSDPTVATGYHANQWQFGRDNSNRWFMNHGGSVIWNIDTSNNWNITGSLTSSGFIHSAINSNNYVLLGAGGYKLESSLNVANANETPYTKQYIGYAGGSYIGWVTIGKWELDSNNYFDTMSFDVSFVRNYNSPSSESYIVNVTVGWCSTNIRLINKKVGNQIINQVRLALDSTNHILYLQYYVNTSYTTYQNSVYVTFIGKFSGLIYECNVNNSPTTVNDVCDLTIWDRLEGLVKGNTGNGLEIQSLNTGSWKEGLRIYPASNNYTLVSLQDSSSSNVFAMVFNTSNQIAYFDYYKSGSGRVIYMPYKAGTIALTTDISDYTYSKSDSDDRYVNVTGDTMTGDLTTTGVWGAGTSNRLVFRHLDGLNCGGDYGLYLQYYTGATIYLGGSSYYITNSGSYYNGTSAYANNVAWTGVTSQMQGGNEFNIPDSGYPYNSFWINYLPRNSRSANGTLIADYHFGNLGTGYASLTAAGFKKNGSDDTYVLLGGGGHKALSDFSMAHSHPYLPLAGGTMDSGAQILVGTISKGSSNVYNGGIQLREATYSTTSCTDNMYDAPGITFHWGGWWAHKLNMHTNALYWDNDKIWHSGNDGSGSGLDADTVDSLHASDFLRHYNDSSLNANDAAVGWHDVANSISNAANGNHSTLIYVNNVGTPFQLQIPDSSEPYIYKRYYSGGWQSWFKISAGYADSAGYANSAGTISGLSNNNALIDWSDKFGSGNEYTAGSTGLRIGQWKAESSGIILSGDGIYMWAPPDDCSLRFYNEDSGDEIWSIDDSGYFSGSCNYADSAGSATTATYSLNLRGNSLITNLDSGTMYNRIYWHADNATGNPSSGAYGNLLVISNNSTTCTPGTNGHWIQQIDFTHDNKIWHRQRVNTGAWSSWEVILTSANYSNYISGGSVSMSAVSPGGTDTTYRLALTSSYSGSVSNLYCISGLYANSNGVYYSSDINLKTDIKKFFLNQELVENPIKAFRWKNTNSQAVGFIAQEVQSWCPEAVLRTEDNTLTVNYNVALSALCGVLYNRIKELEETVKNLQNQINTK